MKKSDIRSAIREAIGCYQAGNLVRAEQLYRKVVAAAPEPLHHADLGIVLEARGKYEEAAAAYRRAIKLGPKEARPYYNLGNLLWSHGRNDEAAACFQEAITVKPDYADAHNSLGWLLVGKGQVEKSVSHFLNAIAARPDFHYAHNNLGIALYRNDRLEEAIQCFRRAVELKPDYAEAYDNLGSTYLRLGRIEEAIPCHRRAIELKPDYAEAYGNLGSAHLKLDQFEEAMHCYDRAIELKPEFAEAYASLGAVHLRLKQFEAAIQCCRRAIELKPDLALAHGNLGAAHLANCYSTARDLDDAIECYEQAIDLTPDNGEYHWEFSAALLLKGDYGRGWKEYEWRWQGSPNLKELKVDFSGSQWKGEDISGKTILLLGEQGRGDIIQFIRYAPMVAARGAAVVVACHPELVRLLGTVKGVSGVVSIQQPLPRFDIHCLLLSLPLLFNTTLYTIPSNVPYITAEQVLIESWRNRIGTSKALKVGLIWGGWSGNSIDGKRSIALADFSPLASVEGVQFYSLQKGEHAEQAKSPPAGMTLIDWAEDIHDFADTAALMANLDLIISVDTAALHLAGALGRPAWLLNRHESEWRWLLDRDDTPWYPTLTIFRQPKLGDWKTVMEQVAEALKTLVSAESLGAQHALVSNRL